jgi:hypothetical protein
LNVANVASSIVLQELPHFTKTQLHCLFAYFLVYQFFYSAHLQRPPLCRSAKCESQENTEMQIRKGWRPPLPDLHHHTDPPPRDSIAQRYRLVPPGTNRTAFWSVSMASKPFTSREYSSLGQDVLFFLEIFEPKTLQIRQFWKFSNRAFERNSTL